MNGPYRLARASLGVMACAILLLAATAGMGGRKSSAGWTDPPQEVLSGARPATGPDSTDDEGPPTTPDSMVVFRFNPRSGSFVIDSIHPDGASASAKAWNIAAQHGRASVVRVRRVEDGRQARVP